MKHRVIIPFLALAAFAGWALHGAREPRPEPSEDALVVEAAAERVEAPRFDEWPGLAQREHEPSAPRSIASTPLDRQRDRLQDTAARLVARRDEARAASAPEATVRALDAHLERVEQQLAALDVDEPTRAAARGSRASRAASSAGASP
jgi:hypothetical protein